MAILQQQMEIQKKIVPDDKDADQFIRLLHDTASTAGIQIRRYASMPVANHEFYSDVPFAIERIVNIDNLQMSNTKTTSPSKVKGTYKYEPGETVVASCTATTFFSHEADQAAPAPAPAKPGQAPAGAAAPAK